MSGKEIDFKRYIRNIPDWPKKGIMFRDITPLLSDYSIFSAVVDSLCGDYSNDSIDYVAAVEARGFIFGGAVAERLGAGFIPIRKGGKLPWDIEAVTYSLEYGVDKLEIHKDAFAPGSKVLLIDDLIATGGSMLASCELIERLGGQVAGIAFLVELTGLGGREVLKNYSISSLVKY